MGVYMSTCSSRLMEILGQADAHGGASSSAHGGEGGGGATGAAGNRAGNAGGRADFHLRGNAARGDMDEVARAMRVREREREMDDDSDDDLDGGEDGAVGMRARGSQAGSNSLRSIDSLVSTHIQFKNRSSVPVKLFWINYDGEEVPYRTLQLGQSCRQQTFVTHPWTFRSASQAQKPVACKKRTVVFPTPNELTVQIEHPSALRWSRTNHLTHFPVSFHTTVEAMMKCHYRSQSMSHEQDSAAQSSRSPIAEAKRVRIGGGWNSPAAQDEHCDSTAPDSTSLGDLPKDLILEIIARAAPYVPDIVPLSSSDLETYQRGEIVHAA